MKGRIGYGQFCDEPGLEKILITPEVQSSFLRQATPCVFQLSAGTFQSAFSGRSIFKSPIQIFVVSAGHCLFLNHRLHPRVAGSGDKRPGNNHITHITGPATNFISRAGQLVTTPNSLRQLESLVLSTSPHIRFSSALGEVSNFYGHPVASITFSAPVPVPAATAVSVPVQTNRKISFTKFQTPKQFDSIIGQHQKLIRQLDSTHYNFADILRLNNIENFQEAFSLQKLQPKQIKLKNHFSSGNSFYINLPERTSR